MCHSLIGSTFFLCEYINVQLIVDGILDLVKYNI